MPRTPAYVSPFESLIKKPADRRSVIAAGVTAMLALPAAAAMSAASASGNPAQPDDGWPGFSEWVRDAVALDEQYEHARLASFAEEQQHAHEDAVTDRMGELCDQASELSRLMARVDDNSTRRMAMLITLAIWGAEKGSSNSFDYTSIGNVDDDIAEDTAAALLRALGPFAAATLPEVPFGRRYGQRA